MLKVLILQRKYENNDTNFNTKKLDPIGFIKM